ncbi:SDR family NAD(P)-dependent oxidoreductase [Paraburkholderia sp. Ac-20347]|uniref:SDR family NAD(P)-dependent oxidoreductase n=1 Tax=Paraburkholderia sp. Ac-20347 TaxID=2703892 RepID=UPI00198102FE|nr:SDR family NAD(P)-dependent oxidoreductase [Paraburkholderia sp. Ac-20347]MBN3808840.1 SDR family oxidoreductase [Paraburkholderia sp. Ac-20347]
MQTLTGKTAVVTGASRGSGRAAALALAKAGAQVIVHYRQSADQAQALVADIRAMGSRSDAIAADLASPDGPHRLARRVRAIVGERLDILVANAGIHAHSAAGDSTVDDFTRQFALDVRAPYFLVQQLLPIMCKGSSVVFLLPCTAQAAAKRGPADAAESAVTGAVQTMSRHFAHALGERGVRVNAISLAPEGHEHVVTFLASDVARWITGASTPGDHR